MKASVDVKKTVRDCCNKEIGEKLLKLPGQTFSRINRVIVSAALFDADSIVMISLKNKIGNNVKH